MDDAFVITVNYKGVDRDFEAELQVMGYIHKFRVEVGEVPVFFERDEEGGYRAVVPRPEDGEKQGSLPDVGLLKAISEKIEEILA